MIINLEKLKTCNSFAVKIPEHILDLYAKNVNEYFISLEKNFHKVKPSESVDIVSALTSFKEYFNSDSEWEHLTLQSLDILRKGAKGLFFDKIAAFGGMTHVAFAIQGLLEKTHKINPFFQSINNILLDNTTAFLKKSSNKEFNSSGNFEIIKGLSGPLRYFIQFDDEKMKNMAKQIIDVFIKRSKEITILNHNITGWHYYPSKIEEAFMDIDASNGCINYGVSHGMGGPLATLSIAHKSGLHSDMLIDVINGLISEYMNALYYINDIAYWPGRVNFEQYIGAEDMQKSPGRMSWCYGSVGILRTIYMSGDLVCDESIKKFALDELIKIAKMDLSEYQLFQPIVCHGYIGTAAILNAMYLETGRVEFLQKIIEMIEASAVYTIECFLESEKQRTDNPSSRAGLHNHLEGYNGIMQTILSILKSQPSANEKRLLII